MKMSKENVKNIKTIVIYYESLSIFNPNKIMLNKCKCM